MNDPHTLKAAEIFKVSVADVTPEMRRFGKIANYLTWYRHNMTGASHGGTALDAGA